jgi:hypothetical protein
MQLIPGQVLGGHTSHVRPPSFSPDGYRFAAGDRTGGLIVFEQNGEESEAGFTVAAQIQTQSYGRFSLSTVGTGVAWSQCGSLLASNEGEGLRTRRPNDLSEVAAATGFPFGPIAFGGGGKWLAVLGDGVLAIVDFPTLERRGYHFLGRGGFEYFHTLGIAADPAGSLVAVGDDGGRDETAMGAVLASGTPRVSLLDAERGAIVGAIEQGDQVDRLAFDPWRGQIVTAAYDEIRFWQQNAELVRRFRPYEQLSVPPYDKLSIEPYEELAISAFAVTERWLITSPETPVGRACLELWDAVTLDLLTTAPIPGGLRPDWIVASPDGKTFLTPGIRVWTISD